MKKLKLVQNGNEVSSLFPHPQALTTDSLKEARYLVTTAFKKLSPHFPQSLTLCEGCRVMLTSNLDTSKGLVNGCLGTVTAIKPSPESPTKIDEIRVLFDKHEQPEIVPYLASEAVIYNGLLKVSRSQFPLVLAGAFTIHKSQGLTIPFLHVNLKGVFEAGQAYVAVSRGVSLNQMIVKGAQPSCFWASPEAIAFDDILALTAKYPPNCNSTDEQSYQECLQKIKEELKNNTEQNIRRKAKQKSEKVESPPDHTIPFNTTKDFTKNLTGQHIHSRPKSKSLLQEHRDEFHRSRISQESDDDYDFNDNFLEQDNYNDNVQDDQLLSEDEEHSSSSFSSSKSSRSSNSTSNNNSNSNSNISNSNRSNSNSNSSNSNSSNSNSSNSNSSNSSNSNSSNSTSRTSTIEIPTQIARDNSFTTQKENQRNPYAKTDNKTTNDNSISSLSSITLSGDTFDYSITHQKKPSPEEISELRYLKEHRQSMIPSRQFTGVRSEDENGKRLRKKRRKR